MSDDGWEGLVSGDSLECMVSGDGWECMPRKMLFAFHHIQLDHFQWLYLTDPM